MAARRNGPDYDAANPTDRALARQKGSFAVRDKAELAALIHVAGCAALRLHLSTKDPEVQEIQDVLFALSGALARGDSKLRKTLHRPALKDLADREEASKKAFRDGMPSEIVPGWYEARLRSHGGTQRLGEDLIEVARCFPRGFAATSVADLVVLVALRGEFESLDPETVRKGIIKKFNGGASGVPEDDARRIASVLFGDAKKANNMVSVPLHMAEKRRKKS